MQWDYLLHTAVSTLTSSTFRVLYKVAVVHAPYTTYTLLPQFTISPCAYRYMCVYMRNRKVDSRKSGSDYLKNLKNCITHKVYYYTGRQRKSISALSFASLLLCMHCGLLGCTKLLTFWSKKQSNNNKSFIIFALIISVIMWEANVQFVVEPGAQCTVEM